MRESPLVLFLLPTVLFALLLMTMAAVPAPALSAEKVKVHGYLEFRKSAFLIVDGQRITVDFIAATEEAVGLRDSMKLVEQVSIWGP